MCKITLIQYTCHHTITHTWSSCRGLVKFGKHSSTPACLKLPSLHLNATTPCGSCSRTRAEKAIRRELQLSETEEPIGDQKAIYDARMADVNARIPIANWRSVTTPEYGRKPSEKRPAVARRTSLLREEVLPEEACGPADWEGNVVGDDRVALYETVCSGWDWEWTDETKRLEDEVSEDRVERVEGVEVEDEDEDLEQAECCEGEGKVEVDGEVSRMDTRAEEQCHLPCGFQPIDSSDSMIESEGNNVFSSIEDRLFSGTVQAWNTPTNTSGDENRPTSDISLEKACTQSAMDGNVSSEKESLPPPQDPYTSPGNSRVRYWFRPHKSSVQGQVGSRPWELVFVT